MDLNLTTQTALVTASSGGIGLEIARSLAREGTRIIINGRTEDSVNKAIADILNSVPSATLLPLAADNGTAAGCAATIKAYPNVDILVNNLGIYEAVGFFDETDEAWQRLFDVNIMSGVRLSPHYLKGMLERDHGRIVFISSESGLNPAPEMAHYSATKTMQLSISRNLAEMTKGTAVTVNAILPGPTATEGVQKFVAGIYPGMSAEAAEKAFIVTNRPTSLLQRFIRPQEVGDAVVFIVSPKASAINGATLRVDGGVAKYII